MADIRPFKAIRPAETTAADIAALPYDVYNRSEAKAAVEGRPLSFLHIDRPEINFPDDTDMYSDEVYDKAHEILWDMIKDGKFIQDEKPCYYIYELTMQGRVQTGIVACAAVKDYEDGVILRHENTRADKEADRIRHVDTCDAQTGPIFLAYRQDKVLHEITERVKHDDAAYDFTSDDGIRHRVFVISDKDDIDAIEKEFKNISHIYIADGHHRAASAVRVGQRRRVEAVTKEQAQAPSVQDKGESASKDDSPADSIAYEYFLSVLFPDEELKIYDYNRVVKDLNGLTAEEFRNDLLKVATPIKEATDPIRPKEKGHFSVFIEDRWYLYSFKSRVLSTDPVKGLDVSILQDQVLSPMLGIDDPKTDPRIDFVGGIRGLGELERRVHTDCAVAFAMYPTSISELFAVADAGLLMPPKSTWFEPKLRSGLFIHSLKR